MKLHDLISALADEIEIVQPDLDRCLNDMEQGGPEDAAFFDAFEQYSSQIQRMGEATGMAGFPGLEAVCGHVLENVLLLAAYPPEERGSVLQFLRVFRRIWCITCATPPTPRRRRGWSICCVQPPARLMKSRR